MTGKFFASSFLVVTLVCFMSTSVVAAASYGNYQAFPNKGSKTCIDMLFDATPSPVSTLTMTTCNPASYPSQKIRQDIDTGSNDGVNYALQFSTNGNVLDVSDSSGQIGGEVIQWQQKTADAGWDNQLWSIEKAGDFFQIINKNSGLCLTANDNYRYELIQNTCCSDNDFQLWDLNNLLSYVPDPSSEYATYDFM